MGFLCPCQFVHPEHKVNATILLFLRLQHSPVKTRDAVVCIYIGHKVELANSVNIMSHCYKAYFISMHLCIPLCFTEVYISFWMHCWKTRDNVHWSWKNPMLHKSRGQSGLHYGKLRVKSWLHWSQWKNSHWLHRSDGFALLSNVSVGEISLCLACFPRLSAHQPSVCKATN